VQGHASWQRARTDPPPFCLVLLPASPSPPSIPLYPQVLSRLCDPVDRSAARARFETFVALLALFNRVGPPRLAARVSRSCNARWSCAACAACAADRRSRLLLSYPLPTPEERVTFVPGSGSSARWTEYTTSHTPRDRYSILITLLRVRARNLGNMSSHKRYAPHDASVISSIINTTT